MMNDRSIFTYDHIKGTHTEVNPDKSTNMDLSALVEFKFNYEVSYNHFLYFQIKELPKEKETILGILHRNYPLYNGFIKLLPKHYNYPYSKPGLRRVFDDDTGDMIGFLVPAFDFSNPGEWKKYTQ